MTNLKNILKNVFILTNDSIPLLRYQKARFYALFLTSSTYFESVPNTIDSAHSVNSKPRICVVFYMSEDRFEELLEQASDFLRIDIFVSEMSIYVHRSLIVIVTQDKHCRCDRHVVLHKDGSVGMTEYMRCKVRRSILTEDRLAYH